MKIKFVINNCYGRFSISKEATEWMAQKGHEEMQKELAMYENMGYYRYGHFGLYLDRADPLLVEAVETLGKNANGPSSDLSVEEYELKIKDFINQYDGKETFSIRS